MAVSLCGLTGRPGELVRGRWALPVTLPGGGVPEAIPVVIATGRDADAEAPRLLLSANVHGPEYNGLIVAHRVIEWLETAAPSGLLRGTVVVFPNLNPSGHRGGTRWPVFDSGIDPNRQWPDARPLAARDPAVVAGFSNGYSGDMRVPDRADDSTDDPLAQWYARETPSGDSAIAPAWAALQTEWRGVGFDCYLDLHTMGGPLTTPCVYIDRVLYDGDGGPAARTEAEQLLERHKQLCIATGLSILVSGSAAELRSKPSRFFRSTAGSMLQGLRVPSIMIEAGPGHVAEPHHRDAALAACMNAIAWNGNNTAGTYTDVSAIVSVNQNPDDLHREIPYPVVDFGPEGGVVDIRVDAGEAFEVGDTLATVRTMEGELLREIKAELPGFVFTWSEGVTHAGRMELGIVGTPDRSPMLLEWSSLRPSAEAKL
jgi:predicted deacylase